MNLIKLPFVLGLAFGAISLVSGCSRPNPEANVYDDSAMVEAGYTRAPSISSIKIVGQHEVTIKGVTMPDGRARFLHMGQAVGFTADAKGRFAARLPLDKSGDVYEFQIEDRGRLVKAEGVIFIPCCDVSRTALLRPGASSIVLGGATAAISSIDINGGQAISVSGYVKPNQAVTLYINGSKNSQTLSDKQGRYEFLSDTKSGNAQQIIIESASGRFEKMIDLGVPLKMEGTSSHINETQQAWIVNWGLVGGGTQTSYIFKSN